MIFFCKTHFELLSQFEFVMAPSGSRQYCLAQEVPCTPEALRLHRNTLTMELLWIQQAIDSRKKVWERKAEIKRFPTFIQQWRSAAVRKLSLLEDSIYLLQ